MRKNARKTVALLLAMALMSGTRGAITYAAENTQSTSDTGNIVQVENDDVLKIGNLNNFEAGIDEDYLDTQFISSYGYYSSSPDVIGFWDYQGMYNVAYVNSAYFSDGWGISINTYDTNFNVIKTINIKAPYSLFGNITADEEGNYYVVWGEYDNESENGIVMCVSKYDYTGKFIAKCELTGYETTPYTPGDYWGTKIPFDAGNCSVAINDGILACNYAREMYSGHQSNFAFYINCDTMERITGNVPYTSHSFDQRTLPTSDGGFIMLNHGDAYYRGFSISKIASDLSMEGTVYSFHFREGSDRSYGYNETYAQLGGIAETENAYVFCGSSERTLSLDVAPTNAYYCGHSESRDLFIQILKKDFYNYSGEKQYLVEGETRAASGERPDSANTSLYLQGSEIDYGVIWLTDYDDEYYVNNPHIISTDENKIVILWEKASYSSPYDAEAYFAILNEDGTYSCKPTKLNGVLLAGNIDPVYMDGNVYWTTVDRYGNYIHSLTVSEKEVVLEAPVIETSNVDNGVKITWDKIDKAAGYYVYRKSEGGTYKMIATIKGATGLTYTDTTAKSGTTYTYTVGAYNDNGNYVTTYNEDGDSIKYLAPPQIIGFEAAGNGIKIKWNKVEGAEAYRVFRKAETGSWMKVGDTTGISYTDTATDRNATYVYMVRCTTKDGTTYTSYFNEGGTAYTGMVKCEGTWWYVTRGAVDTGYTGMAKNKYGWWYMTDGKLDTTYTGMAKNKYGWWYMTDGKLDTTYTGMAKNKYGWWYMTDGKLNTTYTGMAKNKYGWWYMTNGKLDTTYTGMAKNKYGWWYMTDGKLDTTYTGMAKNKYGWWYMTDGKLDTTYTGMAKNKYGWWYMKNGELDTTYTGIAQNEWGKWYMKEGRLQLGFSGTVTLNGVKYNIVNGKVK